MKKASFAGEEFPIPTAEEHESLWLATREEIKKKSFSFEAEEEICRYIAKIEMPLLLAVHFMKDPKYWWDFVDGELWLDVCRGA